jgi:hypothetical protein
MKYYFVDHIKNGMVWACSTYGGEVYTGVWWKNLMETGNLGDPAVDGRIILRWIFRKQEGGCGDWMELAQDRDRFHKMGRIS